MLLSTQGETALHFDIFGVHRVHLSIVMCPHKKNVFTAAVMSATFKSVCHGWGLDKGLGQPIAGSMNGARIVDGLVMFWPLDNECKVTVSMS